MKNLKQKFAPYKLALIAKEKGFYEPCFGKFDIEGSIVMQRQDVLNNPYALNNIYPSQTLTPLYQQIIDWFREKHNIFVFVDIYADFSCYSPTIQKKGKSHTRVGVPVEFTDYYEALNKAIEEAFKLI